MNSMINCYWQICRFRLGPQDLPVSTPLFVVTLLLYVLIGTIIGGFDLPPEKAFLSAIVDVVLLLAMTRVTLWARELWPRFPQTATALLGTGVLYGFVVVPFAWWQSQYPSPADALLPSLLLFVIAVWYVGVVGHILRHALNLPFYAGVGLSLAYTYVSVTIFRAIFLNN